MLNAIEITASYKASGRWKVYTAAYGQFDEDFALDEPVYCDTHTLYLPERFRTSPGNLISVISDRLTYLIGEDAF